MFFEYFESLRKKPVEARKKITLVFTVIITGIIVVIYLLSIFFTKLATSPIKKETDKKETETVLDDFNNANIFLKDPDVNYLKDSNWKSQFENIKADVVNSESDATTSIDVSTSTLQEYNATDTESTLYTF